MVMSRNKLLIFPIIVFSLLVSGCKKELATSPPATFKLYPVKDFSNAVLQTAEAQDGGFYVLVNYQQDASSKEQCMLLRTDASGNEKWRRIYSDSNFTSFTSSEIILDANGQLLLCGTAYTNLL